MRLGFLGVSELFQRDRQVEVRVGIAGVERDGVAIAAQRAVVPAEIVLDVAEIEVRLEAIGVEADRALVERLRLDELVARSSGCSRD